MMEFYNLLLIFEACYLIKWCFNRFYTLFDFWIEIFENKDNVLRANLIISENIPNLLKVVKQDVITNCQHLDAFHSYFNQR